MSLSTQKALLLRSKGAPFELTTRPIPSPGPGQVLIKNVAVALNPVDKYIQKFGFIVDAYGYPALAGSDGAGDIVEVGEGVSGRWVAGDKVLYQSFWAQDRATFQEYTLADAVRIAKIPENLTYEQAATVPLGFSTAAVGLYAPFAPRGGAGLTPPWEEGGRGKYAGKPALVIGGASSVGQFALQLLKLSGFSPIITTASAHNADYCKIAGATHFIDYHARPYASLAASISQITTEPLELIYDAISSPETMVASWNILAPGGTLGVVLQPSVAVPGESDGKRLVWIFAVINDGDHMQFGAEFYKHLSGMLEMGDIKPNRIELLKGGLEGIPDGVERMLSISGVKLIARVDETP
ncbi:GroES-like protein [Vararia minispora EC-137]|uniref:GroES-like protein n=1 Tax=Vararia minispora EC-137 TaxID=1314806 RepID=A0ACB8QNG8_9AGAM|nr:GroES-like protein [Vararia minispora EC-137]